MMEDVYMFAMRSTHQKDNAMKVVATIPFKNMEDQIIDLYNESEIIPDNELYF